MSSVMVSKANLFCCFMSACFRSPPHTLPKNAWRSPYQSYKRHLRSTVLFQWEFRGRSVSWCQQRVLVCGSTRRWVDWNEVQRASEVLRPRFVSHFYINSAVIVFFSGLELQHRPAWGFSIGFLLWRLTEFDTSNPKFSFEFLPQVFLSIFLGRAIDSLNYRWVLSAYGCQMRSWS